MANPNSSLLRRAYDSVALVAILNVVGVSAVVGLLINSGALTWPRVREMIRVVRGEGVVIDADEATIVEPDPDGGATERKVVRATVTPTDVEALRLEAERIKTELDQRLALNTSIMLRVMTEREAFKKEQLAATKRQQAAATKRGETGFRKQIAIYEGLPPKLAVRHLIDLNDPNEAARVLLELDTSQAKKIVESARRGQDMVKMEEILRRLRDVSPDQAGHIRRGD